MTGAMLHTTDPFVLLPEPPPRAMPPSLASLKAQGSRQHAEGDNEQRLLGGFEWS
jgi:hypothetical protein